MAQFAGLVTLCVCLNIFILRDPITARLGGMAGPVAILTAWIAARAWLAGSVARVAISVVLVLIVTSVFASAEFRGRVTPDMARPSRLARSLSVWAMSPLPLDVIPNQAIAGLARYIRECTAPTDRVLATWFVPDLYFYTQRGFAGRSVALFGRHWSEPRFQRRSVEALASQSVPIVITRTDEPFTFTDDYPLLSAYIGDHYSLAGTTDFGDADVGKNGYSVWVLKDRRTGETFADTKFPCFR